MQSCLEDTSHAEKIHSMHDVMWAPTSAGKCDGTGADSEILFIHFLPAERRWRKIS